ncbi:sulfotransferase [Salipiger pacificus]|nr:sulfotransferase [Alloyangia pacifica]MCA0948154.1 sulfotransferase [Alloyangia pacifica]
MSDTAPIFLLGLQRGGSDQLHDALRAHRDTVWPEGALHEVLRPAPVPRAETLQALSGYLPTLLRSGDILNPQRAPGPLRPRDRAWIARELARATDRNLPEVRRYKRALAARGMGPGLPSGRGRMLVKVMNYNIGLATELDRIYPGARFVGLVRDPYDICESMLARGGDPAEILALYRYFGETLLRLEQRGLPLKLVRHEDMVSDLARAVDEVFDLCGLDTRAARGLSLNDRERGGAGHLPADAVAVQGRVEGLLREDAGKSAPARLAPEMAGMIQLNCAAIIERFGYLAPTAMG